MRSTPPEFVMPLNSPGLKCWSHPPGPLDGIPPFGTSLRLILMVTPLLHHTGPRIACALSDGHFGYHYFCFTMPLPWVTYLSQCLDCLTGALSPLPVCGRLRNLAFNDRDYAIVCTVKNHKANTDLCLHRQSCIQYNGRCCNYGSTKHSLRQCPTRFQ